MELATYFLGSDPDSGNFLKLNFQAIFFSGHVFRLRKVQFLDDKALDNAQLAILLLPRLLRDL